MSELRPFVADHLGSALRLARMAELSSDERVRSIRVAYAAARKDWLHHGSAEPSE